MVLGAYKGSSDPSETGYRLARSANMFVGFARELLHPAKGWPYPTSLLVRAELWILIPAFNVAKVVLVRWHELGTHVSVMGWLNFTIKELTEEARTAFNLYDFAIK